MLEILPLMAAARQKAVFMHTKENIQWNEWKATEPPYQLGLSRFHLNVGIGFQAEGWKLRTKVSLGGIKPWGV